MNKNKRFIGGRRENLILLVSLGFLVLWGLSVPRASPAEAMVQQGPVLNVSADVKPCIRTTLSTERIYFYADKGPGTYEPVVQGSSDSPAGPVLMTVGCNAKEWSIQCEVTPLEEAATRKNGENGIIPSAQFSVASPLTQGNADTKAQESYSPLDKPVIILQGGPGETQAELRFQLKTTWSDRAGTYTGKISFTCMMNP
jgi:hypothetical protein